VSGRRRSRIVAFWDWWSAHSDAIAAAISGGTTDRWVPDLTTLVHAIDRGLAWELMPGTESAHCLVVTAEGKDEILELPEEWLVSAPAPDLLWEYRSARPAGRLDRLTVGRFGFDLGGVRARWVRDDDRELLDVDLWHPAWARASPGQLNLFSQIFLDRLLGEVDKRRWIGVVDTPAAAGDGLDPASLRAAVAGMAEDATRQKWLTITSRSVDGRDCLVTYNGALKRIDHPHATWHIVIEIERRDPEPEGSQSRLTGDIVALLEGHHGRLAAIVDADRTSLHFVLDPIHGGVAAAMQWAHARQDTRVDAHADPAWHFRRDLGVVG